MHQQVQNSTTVRSAHIVVMCFVVIWEQTAKCSTYTTNWLVFITEMKRVYTAVRTGSLTKAVYACATYSINWLVYITEMKRVYSAVRTGALTKAVCASSVKGKNFPLHRNTFFSIPGAILYVFPHTECSLLCPFLLVYLIHVIPLGKRMFSCAVYSSLMRFLWRSFTFCAHIFQSVLGGADQTRERFFSRVVALLENGDTFFAFH
jgi:hypothetical protein